MGFDAYLGKVYNAGQEVELGGGLNFDGSTITAVWNPVTKQIDIVSAGGGGGGSSFPLSADVSAATHKITNLGAPTAGSTNACTALYAETVASSAAAAVASTIPAAGGAPAAVTKAAASAGVATSYARSDHKHDVSTAAVGAVALSTTSPAEGSATTLARSDHTHSVTPDFGSQVARGAAQFVCAATGAPSVHGDAGSFEACTTGSGSARGFVSRQASADANGARFVAEKSRGTHASPAAHAASDVIGAFVSRGHDGTTFYEAASLKHVAYAAGGTSKCTMLQVEAHGGSTQATVQNFVSPEVTTTTATQATVVSLALPVDGMVSLGVRWSGIEAATGKRAFKEITMVVRRVGSANPTLVGSNTVTPFFSDDLTWGDDTQTTYAFNSSTKAIDFKVKGQALTTVAWTVELSWRAL